MKKRYYILFIVSLVFLLYILFITTDLFVPKREEISNQKALFKQVFFEIAKNEKKSDTIFFVKYDFYDSNGGGGECGNEEISSKFRKKINQINDIKRDPFFIDFENSFDDIYYINNKIVIVGKSQYPNFFISKISSFYYDQNNKRNIYRLIYKIENQNKVKITVNNSQSVIMILIMTFNDKKWSAVRTY